MSNNTIIQEKKRKLPRNVRFAKKNMKYRVAFTRDKETYWFGSYDTVDEAEDAAVSIREQLEEESIEVVKEKFDQEKVRILCRLLFFSLNSPRV